MENLKVILRIIFDGISVLALIIAVGFFVIMFISLCIDIFEDEIAFERTYNYHDKYLFSSKTKASLIVISGVIIAVLILFLFFWAYS